MKRTGPTPVLWNGGKQLWNRMWFSGFDPLPAGVFRIAFGVLLLTFFICLIPNWREYYGKDGYMSLTPSSRELWSVFRWADEYFPVQVYLVVALIASVAFTLGWHTRFFTVILFVLVSSMMRRNPMIVNGDDLVFRMLLLYSCFAPLGQTL